jgi:hypothetical protein
MIVAKVKCHVVRTMANMESESNLWEGFRSPGTYGNLHIEILLAMFLAKSGDMELTEIGIVEEVLVEENDTGAESDPDTIC